MLKEITSYLLRRLQITREIAGFHHMQVSDVTDATKPEVPALVGPLLLEYRHVF